MAETLLNKNQAGEGIWHQDNLVAGSGISITQVPQPVIDANTLGVWHFENNLDNAVSGSDYQITTLSQNFTSDYKKFGTYSQYDTLSSQVVLFPSKSLSGSFTLDFWCCPGAYGSRMIGLHTSSSAGSNRANNGPLYIAIDGGSSTAKIGFWTIATSGTNVVTVEPNSWHHLALEVDNNTGRLYLDGELKFTNTGLSSAYYIHDAQNTFSGVSGNPQPRIDEMRLSNVARYQGNNFTPYTVPYASSAGPAQYAINNTKADPDLSSYLQNTATGSNSLTIDGTANSYSQSINLGNYTTVYGNQSVAIGAGVNQASAAAAGSSSIAIGYSAKAAQANSVCIGRETQADNGPRAIAIGYGAVAYQQAIAIGSVNSNYANRAQATAQSAIQLGSGTNNTSNTFQVFNTTVVDANGKIPSANLDISPLQNTATGTDSLTIKGIATSAPKNTNVGESSIIPGNTGYGVAVGYGATGSTGSVVIGAQAQATDSNNVTIGRNAVASSESISIGGSGNYSTATTASGADSIAIGYNAKATASTAIQIGTGTNNVANTVKIKGTTILDANGKVPMSSTDITSLTGYDATKTQVLKNVNGTLTWVDEA